MPLPRRYRAVLISAAALVGASLGGVGLAHYAQGEAFFFYKQRPTPAPDLAMPGSPPSGGGYSVQGADPPVEAFAAPASQPVRAYLPPAETEPTYPSYDDPVPLPEGVRDDAPLPSPEPVVEVTRGSWSEPANSPGAGGESAAPADRGDDVSIAEEAPPPAEPAAATVGSASQGSGALAPPTG